MVQVDYKRPGTPAKPIKMTKEMVYGKKKDFTGLTQMKPNHMNPKLKNKLNKKGLQGNYSK